MIATEVLSELNIFKVVGTGFVGLDPFEPVVGLLVATDGPGYVL